MHGLAQRDRTVLLLSLLVFVALGTAPRRADACSCSIDPSHRSPSAPSLSTTAFPTNALFTSAHPWRDLSGASLVLAQDEARSAALGLDVRRPVDDIAPGSVFFLDDGSCPSSGECEFSVVFGAGPDETPPSAAEIVDLTVSFAEGAPEEGVSCQVDSLVLEVDGTDDATPREQLTAVVFVGATEEEVASAEAVRIGFAFDGLSPSGALQSTMTLGGAEGHRRGGDPLSVDGPVCIAVALADWAGNVGERSETRCFDSTDPADPSITLVAYDPPCSGAYCAALPGAGSQSSVVVVALLAALGISRSRRRARR